MPFCLVQWSRHHAEEFACVSNDLRLYEVRTPTDIRVAKINFDLQQIRCIAWCPEPASARLITVGLATGKAALVNFSGEGAVVKEFLPKHNRPCNALAWSPVEPELIAVGLNKLRNDHCTLVWDVRHSPTNPGKKSRGSPVAVSTPLHALGHSESAASLAWAPHQPQTLIIGTGFKWMRIFDLRDANNPIPVVAHAKNVFGACFNPRNEHSLATYSDDGTIKVWDTRMLTKRASQDSALWFATGTKVTQIGWCPSRPGVLASISEGSPILQLWDTNSGERVEPSDDTQPMTIKPCQVHENTDGEPIVSFDWHSTVENRILLATASGEFHDVTVRRPMAVTWSAQGSIAFSCERCLYISPSAGAVMDEPVQDIAEDMRRRAQAGYAMDLALNIKAIDSGMAAANDLRALWLWMLDLSERWNRKEPGVDRPLQAKDWSGIAQVIMLEPNQSTRSPHPGVPGVFSLQAPWRHHALSLLDASFENAEATEQRLKELQDGGRHSEAAMQALFHVGLERAVTALTSGGAEMAMAALGLAGYGRNEHLVWQTVCGQVPTTTADPYLGAIFTFLSCAAAGTEFSPIVNDTALKLPQKIAFACRFLTDTQFTTWVEEASQHAVREGDLNALVLTGLSPLGCELLQSYVDHTSDVQTAALLMTHVVPVVFENERATLWLETYRELLDMWQMWHHRARLDVTRARLSGTYKAQAQTFARCFYCKEPLCAALLPRATASQRPMGSMFGRGAQRSEGIRMMVCPNLNCNKELPKCSVCLLPLEFQGGTDSTIRGDNISNVHHSELSQGGAICPPATGFRMWLTWCQTCKHGGHTTHLLSWFRTHNICPVPGCDCQCGLLDTKVS